MPGTEPQTGSRHCANHPKVETAVSCSDCGKPICPDCMVHAAVGIKCRDCARLPRSARVALKYAFGFSSQSQEYAESKSYPSTPISFRGFVIIVGLPT